MKKNLNKLATLALTGAMVAGMSFGAMAAETAIENGVATNAMVKRVVTDGKTFAPNTTFNFKVSNVGDIPTQLESVAGKIGERETTLKDYLTPTTGIEDGAVTVSSIKFEADRDGSEGLTASDLVADGTVTVGSNTYNYYEGKSDITVNASKFSKPGIYVFALNEEDGEYEGVTYNTNTYYLLVNVQRVSEEGDVLVAEGVQLVRLAGTGDSAKAVKVDSFYNNYGGENLPDPDPENPDVPKDDKVYDLTVKKHISGIGANTGAEFKFTFKVNTSTESADSAYIVEDAQGVQTVITPNTAAEYTFTQDKTYKIYGLSASDTVTVTEEKAGADGYTTTYTLNNVSQETKTGNLTTESNSVDVNASANGATAVVTNDKSSITVTGVAMNIAPYAAMVLGAGAFAGIFLGMKKKDEE